MVDESTRRGERTRAEILLAAHDLFTRQGYHGTSMRQIALQAGVALGGLYNHFENKEHVFYEVFTAYHPYNAVIPAMITAPGKTLEQFLSNVIRVLVDSMKARPDFLNLMFIEIVEFNSAHVAEIFGQIVPLALQIIDKMNHLDTGSLRKIEPLLLMRIMVSMFMGFYLTEIAFTPHLPREFSEGAVDKYSEVLLHGLLTTAG